jgi:DNA-binding transcriptional ArsR family regulator
MRNNESDLARHLTVLKALASPIRLAVLDYLKDPVGNFPPQVDGDPIADGICADFLRDKLGIAAATASRHLTLLTDCGLLIATRKKGWTFYRRDDAAIAAFIAALKASL